MRRRRALRERLAFVDGVRRIEASLYVSDGDQLAVGIAGAHACGAAIVDGGSRMEFGEARVSRLAIFGSGVTRVPAAVRRVLVAGIVGCRRRAGGPEE